MDEKETPREETRLNLHDESGMTRRDLMRRGAIVGGTLLWVAPAIQSIGSKAYAQVGGQGPSPGNCAACYCYSTEDGSETGNVTKQECSFDGVAGFRENADDCENFCQSTAAANGPYQHSKYCSGTDPSPGVGTSICQCVTGPIGGSPGEAVCV